MDDIHNDDFQDAQLRALEDAKLATDAEKIRADDIDQPPSVDGRHDEESVLPTDADKLRADELPQPAPVAGLTDEEGAFTSDARKIRADALDQPASVAGLHDVDEELPAERTGGRDLGGRTRTGANAVEEQGVFETEAERIRPDDIDEPPFGGRREDDASR
jgi:hypothetical protein